MRAALATAELDDADLRQIYEELKSIKTTALDPAGKLAMAITRSQTETRLASHAAVKALFALAPAADAPDGATESKTDVLDPSGRLAMAITRSQTEAGRARSRTRI